MNWARMGFSKNQGGLGFRDLVIFNKAFLAKQVWRLMHNPNSLPACIFKSNYYPRCYILEATLGNRPSYAWRSMISARHVVINGMIWRVGDERDIQIWGDHWLLTPIYFVI
jgi:hypothetical protein